MKGEHAMKESTIMKRVVRRVALLLLMMMLPAAAAAAGTFDFVVETTTANQTLKFYTPGAVNFTVDWGDGTAAGVYNGTAYPTHEYAAAGVYTNKVSGAATRIAFGGVAGTTPLRLRDIVSRLDDGVTGITLASSMFQGAANITRFSQADWFDVASSNVTTMESMFSGASSFDQDISGWAVGKVTKMNAMFFNAVSFNQDLDNWAVSNVTDMSQMFYGASAFNGEIGGWDVGKVTTMASMFNGATTFNQDIGGWDVGKVTTMAQMFRGATAFNRAIGDWDVGKVGDMSYMFYSATAFNQAIGGWDVGQVTTMNRMFYGVAAFKQDVSRWNVANVADLYWFMNGVTLPTELYNRLLIRWSRLPLKTGVTFTGGSSKYDLGLPAERRHYIIDTFNWTITDGGCTGNPYKDANLPTWIFVR